jgi:transcriptional regulator with XRE-family HTH domain
MPTEKSHKVAVTKFREYLKRNRIRQTKAARELGVSDGLISMLCAGRTPSLGLAQRICLWTNGEIDPMCWGSASKPSSGNSHLPTEGAE